MASHPVLLSAVPAKSSVHPGVRLNTHDVASSTLYRWRNNGLIRFDTYRKCYVLTEAGAKTLGYSTKKPGLIKRFIDFMKSPATP